MKPAANSLLTVFYIFLYSVIISFSLGSLIIFKPFTHLDNDKTQIVCLKNNSAFDIGPNFIYSFTDKLDSFNDKKARKLCEFGIIRDYGDSYKSPESINYYLKPAYQNDSSWGDAVFIASVCLLAGFILLRRVKNIIFSNSITARKYLILSVIVGLLIFFTLSKKPATQLFCFRQTAKKVVNFRNAANKNGVYRNPEEDNQLLKISDKSYLNCLTNENL